jgi:hypothetical protein
LHHALFKLAIAAPNGVRRHDEQQLYIFQRLAATKRGETLQPRRSLDAQISTLVTYWAAPPDWQIFREFEAERRNYIVRDIGLAISGHAPAHRTKASGQAGD